MQNTNNYKPIISIVGFFFNIKVIVENYIISHGKTCISVMIIEWQFIYLFYFIFDDGKYNDVSQIWKQGRKIKCRYDHGDPSRVHVFVEKFSVRQSVLLKISALANCF